MEEGRASTAAGSTLAGKGRPDRPHSLQLLEGCWPRTLGQCTPRTATPSPSAAACPSSAGSGTIPAQQHQQLPRAFILEITSKLLLPQVYKYMISLKSRGTHYFIALIGRDETGGTKYKVFHYKGLLYTVTFLAYLVDNSVIKVS